MIVLFTDFGARDPYVGQLHAVLAQAAPDERVVDLLHEVPAFDIRAGAYLLAALAADFPPDAVFLCVVDPGVGSARAPVIVAADGHRLVGPDNGLFEIVARRARRLECRTIRWRPPRMSDSFHGRDLFAPVAARLARGEAVESEPCSLTPQPPADWPDDLARIIYIDHYGNAVTGLRASKIARDAVVAVGAHRLRYARVFSAAPSGEGFWYENSSDLLEIAMYQADAARALNLSLGMKIQVAR